MKVSFLNSEELQELTKIMMKKMKKDQIFTATEPYLSPNSVSSNKMASDQTANPLKSPRPNSHQESHSSKLILHI